jgi:hypothetical protein
MGTQIVSRFQPTESRDLTGGMEMARNKLSRRTQRGVTACGRAAAVLAFTTSVQQLHANSTTYTGASGGSWNIAGNWNDGVPTSTSDAYVQASTGTLFSVNYNDNSTIAELTVYSSASGGVELNQTTTGDNLTSGTEIIAIGSADPCTFNQTAATNTVTGTLYLGSNGEGEGTYSLSSSAVLSVDGDENIGHSGSEAFGTSSTLVQTAGNNNIGGNLYMGGGGASGVYKLSGGTLALTNALTSEDIGNTSPATFIQSGGVNNTSGSNLQIGSPDNPGLIAIYMLSAGSIDNGNFEGIASGGSLIQSGGTNTVVESMLDISSGGLYSLSAGTLNLSNSGFLSDAGTVNQSGGSVVVGNAFVDSGVYSLSGTGSLTVNSRTGFASEETVSGTFSQSGGSNTMPNQGGVPPGTLTVTGTYDLSGGTLSIASELYTVNSGTIGATGGSASLGTVSGAGILEAGGGDASVTAVGLQQNAVTITSGGSVKLTGGGATNAVKSLTISGNGVFDVDTTKLMINFGSGADPDSTIAGYIKSGYNGGGWNGPGIISSAARTATNGFLYGVGWSDGKDHVVSGLSSGEIEVKYTLLGDANLDGVVNGADFSILAANFGKGLTNWDQGNFLFTPAVNGTDFSALARNFGQGDSGTDTSVSQADIAALNSFAIANGLPLPTVEVVPEPGGTSLVVAAGAVWLAHRRKFRKPI